MVTVGFCLTPKLMSSLSHPLLVSTKRNFKNMPFILGYSPQTMCAHTQPPVHIGAMLWFCTRSVQCVGTLAVRARQMHKRSQALSPTKVVLLNEKYVCVYVKKRYQRETRHHHPQCSGPEWLLARYSRAISHPSGSRFPFELMLKKQQYCLQPLHLIHTKPMWQ